jgi:chromosome segregation protein
LYLKKLDIYGFKSFANRTTLSFEPGVTAVVGPNGCGKSNISDSIKWVLGEQSAKELRGVKMEDVIFNGTDNTQPVNLAEVSLTFSNKDRIFPVDYDEVIITRRVYRSGESEYLLNKTQVRLKDITALLAGTGIGVSSYSIAEQGKMDRVLHSKPEDRREIFEEASGITKYKFQRKEALNKLENTENNLVRIADIVNEIKRQVASIERQAQKAEKFKLAYERMKELDIKLALYEYNAVRDSESVKKEDIVSLKQKEGQLSLELNIQQDELRIHRESINTLDLDISGRRQNLTNLLAAIDKNENTVKVNRERIEELKLRAESLSKEIGEITNRSEGVLKRIASLEQEAGLINSEKDKKQQLVEQSERALELITEDIAKCQQEILQSKSAIIENASNQSRVRNEISRISADLNSALSRRKRLTAEENKSRQEIGSISSAFEFAEVTYTQQRKALDYVLQHLHCLKNTCTQLAINCREKSDAVVKLKQRLASSGSKLELLSDMKRKREGLSEGVKTYMEFLENDPCQKELFVGIVADVIDAKEGLIKPLEAVLGEMSQAIIVKNDLARLKALEFLKQGKKGRAHFIVLEEAEKNINNEALAKSVCEQPGLKKLSEAITVRQDCANVINELLSNVYLVDNNRVMSDTGYPGAVFVTRDGDMRKGIVLSGGYSSYDEYTSIIGRDIKIKELSVEVERLGSQVDEYQQEHAQMATSLERIKKDVSFQEEAAKQQEIKLSSIDSQRQKVSEQKDKLQKELELVLLELDEITEEESSLKLRENDLNIRRQALEDESRSIESAVNRNQQSITEKSRERESTMVMLAELRTQLSHVSEKSESHNLTLSMLKSSLDQECTAASDRNLQLDQAKDKIHSLSDDIASLENLNQGLAEDSRRAGQDLSALEEQRSKAHSLVCQVEEKTRLMQKDLDELRSAISNSHLNISELSYSANSIKEKIETEYKFDLNSACREFLNEDDIKIFAEEAALLREKIDRMGPVNMVAIEEHKELKERYDFLSAQQKDLLEAKESLHKAINKINRTTRKMFIETFEGIKAAFKEYFKLLFGGGSADLFLMDQADILESGIEIVVRPPGKKLQSISLLSGGEKALTSVALLFALFKVRPTPFCILDEIDAPLDEANIDRFSRMLEEFIKTTQFIVITHNKKTISVSDVMYGITMESSGISKIVSVKLADQAQIDQRKKYAEEEAARKLKESRTQCQEIQEEEALATE